MNKTDESENGLYHHTTKYPPNWETDDNPSSLKVTTAKPSQQDPKYRKIFDFQELQICQRESETNGFIMNHQLPFQLVYQVDL
jgi:hypothetical protein